MSVEGTCTLQQFVTISVKNWRNNQTHLHNLKKYLLVETLDKRQQHAFLVPTMNTKYKCQAPLASKYSHSPFRHIFVLGGRGARQIS